MPGPGLFARKSINAALAQTESSGYRRALGWFSLTGIGIAATIGAGIFGLLGRAAHELAGPAVVWSILLAGLAAALAGLAYAEFASFLPGAGSAYTYAYTALGRLPAFMMGWLLLVAYAVGNVTVAIFWAEFARALVPQAFELLPRTWQTPPELGGTFNVPAALIVVAVTLACLPKVRESTAVNNALVTVKVLLVVFVILAGARFVDPGNWSEPIPASSGFRGVVAAAALIFFAYLGFDTVSAAGEEARRPRRDLPIGLLASVGVCALLYVAMAAVVTGMQAPSALEPNAPVIGAFRFHGQEWAAGAVAIGSLLGLTTVLYAFHLALARVMHAMARDGFLPRYFDRLHPTAGTPWRLTILTGIIMAGAAGLYAVGPAADMAVLSSIFLYILVCVGVLFLKARPAQERRFRVHWTLPATGIALMLVLAFVGISDPLVHLFFWLWIGLGLALYGFWFHERASVQGLEPAS